MEQVHFEQFETEIRYHFKNRHFLVEALSPPPMPTRRKSAAAATNGWNFWGQRAFHRCILLFIPPVSGTAGGRTDKTAGIPGL